MLKGTCLLLDLTGEILKGIYLLLDLTGEILNGIYLLLDFDRCVTGIYF